MTQSHTHAKIKIKVIWFKSWRGNGWTVTTDRIFPANAVRNQKLAGKDGNSQQRGISFNCNRNDSAGYDNDSITVIFHFQVYT